MRHSQIEAGIRIRIRRRVYAGPRCVFACMNHDTIFVRYFHSRANSLYPSPRTSMGSHLLCAAPGGCWQWSVDVARKTGLNNLPKEAGIPPEFCAGDAPWQVPLRPDIRGVDGQEIPGRLEDQVTDIVRRLCIQTKPNQEAVESHNGWLVQCVEKPRVFGRGTSRGTPFTMMHPRRFHTSSFFWNPKLVYGISFSQCTMA